MSERGPISINTQTPFADLADLAAFRQIHRLLLRLNRVLCRFVEMTCYAHDGRTLRQHWAMAPTFDANRKLVGLVVKGPYLPQVDKKAFATPIQVEAIEHIAEYKCTSMGTFCPTINELNSCSFTMQNLAFHSAPELAVPPPLPGSIRVTFHRLVSLLPAHEDVGGKIEPFHTPPHNVVFEALAGLLPYFTAAYLPKFFYCYEYDAVMENRPLDDGGLLGPISGKKFPTFVLRNAVRGHEEEDVLFVRCVGMQKYGFEFESPQHGAQWISSELTFLRPPFSASFQAHLAQFGPLPPRVREFLAILNLSAEGEKRSIRIVCEEEGIEEASIGQLVLSGGDGGRRRYRERVREVREVVGGAVAERSAVF